MLDLAINTTSSSKNRSWREEALGGALADFTILPGNEFPRIFAFKNWSVNYVEAKMNLSWRLTIQEHQGSGQIN